MEIPCEIDLKGKPYFGPDWKTDRVFNELKQYAGKPATLVVDIQVKESKKMRRFFEGAMVPYFCTLMHIFDRKNPDDVEKVRELLKQEFGGEVTPTFSGGVTKVCITSKGKLREILDSANQYLMENGYAVPDPELYKRWRDVLLREGGDYLDWLIKNNLNVDGTPREVATIDQEPT